MKKRLQLLIITGVMILGLPSVNFAQDLGIIANFAVFSTTGAITFTGTNTVTGNTGSNGTTSTSAPSSQVGINYSSAGAVPLQAATDLATAYNYLSGLTAVTTASTNAFVKNATTTYTAGVYSFTNATGDANAFIQFSGAGTFIMKISGTYSQPSKGSISLTGGALACNVYWVVEGDISIASVPVIGTYISHTGIIALSGSTTVTGRILAMAGTISLAGNTVTIATDCTGTKWIGTSAGSTDFSLGTNWSNGLPSASLKGFIPPTLTATSGYAFPQLSNATSASLITTLGDLSIQPPGTLTIPATYKLQVAGKLTSSGTITATSGTVEMNGSVAQTLPQNVFINNTVNNLIISNKNGSSITPITTTIGGTLNTNITGTLSFGTSNNTLASGGNLTLVSNSSGTAQVANILLSPSATAISGNTITGNVNVQRYLSAKRAWRLLTAPVSVLVPSTNTIHTSWQNNGNAVTSQGIFITGSNPATNGFDASTRNNASMLTYNSSSNTFSGIASTAIALSGTSTSAANIGYFVFVRGDRTSTNLSSSTNSGPTTINSVGNLQTGSQAFTVSSVASAYTLLGNPYAAPVDFNKVTLVNVNKIFYTWDPALNTLGGYVTVSNSTGSYVATPSKNTSTGTTTQTQYLQSGQAFFVQTISGATATVTFDEANKSSANSTNVSFRPMTPTTTTGSLNANLYLLNIDSTTKMADGTLTQFNNNFSDNVVMNEDATKFTNINECFGLSRHGATLAIESRPNLTINDTVFLKLWKTTQRAYRFQFEPGNLNNTNLIGTLQDSYITCSKPISLTDTTTVDFTVDANPASAVANRFQIVFKIFKPFAFTTITAIQKDNTIPVNWTVAYETNITQYEVQKSTDSVNFTKVATQLVAGTNNATNSYNWLDANAVTGDNFYRVKMIAQDGSTSYTKIVKVTIAPITSGIFIYPNPVKNSKINIQMGNQPVGTYQLVLTNNIGQVVYTGTVQNTGNNTQFAITLNNKAAKGMYNLQISNPSNTVSTQKIIVE